MEGVMAPGRPPPLFAGEYLCTGQIDRTDGGSAGRARN